mmetsp:Transcript_822/g.1800  ORF Transcript_822/g.1800 Transcript_822/m.1800 type:complete len:233 (-) Transcript_822:2622-3320(-)
MCIYFISDLTPPQKLLEELPPHHQRWLSLSWYPEAETQMTNLPKILSLNCCLPEDNAAAAAAEEPAVGDDDTAAVAASVVVGSVADLVGADVDLVFVAAGAGAAVESYCSTECNYYFPVLNYSPHPEEIEGDAYSSCWEDCLKHLKFQAKTWQYFDSVAAVVVAAFEMEQAHMNVAQIAADHCLPAVVAAASCASEAVAEPGSAEGPEDAVAASETASRVADDAAAAVDSKT